MPDLSPLVAVIHANSATIPPVVDAFAASFPTAEVWHLVDDRLVKDAERAGGLTPDLAARMDSLIDYAVTHGADAVQLACSMYAPVAVDSRRELPVRASDQAMFDQAVASRPGHVVVLASLEPAARDSEARLRAAFTDAELTPRVEGVVVEGAAQAANAGQQDLLSKLMVQAARDLPDDVDLIVLAQYTLASVAADISAAVTTPVLSGPHLAASTLQALLDGEVTG